MKDDDWDEYDLHGNWLGPILRHTDDDIKGALLGDNFPSQVEDFCYNTNGTEPSEGGEHGEEDADGDE